MLCSNSRLSWSKWLILPAWFEYKWIQKKIARYINFELTRTHLHLIFLVRSQAGLANKGSSHCPGIVQTEQIVYIWWKNTSTSWKLEMNIFCHSWSFYLRSLHFLLCFKPFVVDGGNCINLSEKKKSRTSVPTCGCGPTCSTETKRVFSCWPMNIFKCMNDRNTDNHSITFSMRRRTFRPLTTFCSFSISPLLFCVCLFSGSYFDS